MSYFVPIGVNSPTTVMPSSIASRIGGTTALPSFACTMKAWNSPRVIAFWICDTCFAASKFGSKNSTSTPSFSACSLIPASVAWANEFALAKPKNAILSTSAASPPPAAGPPPPSPSSSPQPASIPSAKAADAASAVHCPLMPLSSSS